MGLFDFFRRKPVPKSGPPACDDELEGLGQPRCRHYSLAHLALRSFAFEEPLRFLGILASPDARKFLDDVLRMVADHCADRQPVADFDSDDLTIHTIRVGPYPCAVVEMPPPRATTEAFFVAAVLEADIDEGLPDDGEVALRYFTLENGLAFDGQGRTVLCEWTKDGTHANYGDGPAPTLDAFVHAIEAHISKR